MNIAYLEGQKTDLEREMRFLQRSSVDACFKSEELQKTISNYKNIMKNSDVSTFTTYLQILFPQLYHTTIKTLVDCDSKREQFKKTIPPAAQYKSILGIGTALLGFLGNEKKLEKKEREMYFEILDAMALDLDEPRLKSLEYAREMFSPKGSKRLSDLMERKIQQLELQKEDALKNVEEHSKQLVEKTEEHSTLIHKLRQSYVERIDTLKKVKEDHNNRFVNVEDEFEHLESERGKIHNSLFKWFLFLSEPETYNKLITPSGSRNSSLDSYFVSALQGINFEEIQKGFIDSMKKIFSNYGRRFSEREWSDKIKKTESFMKSMRAWLRHRNIQETVREMATNAPKLLDDRYMGKERPELKKFYRALERIDKMERELENGSMVESEIITLTEKLYALQMELAEIPAQYTQTTLLQQV